MFSSTLGATDGSALQRLHGRRPESRVAFAWAEGVERLGLGGALDAVGDVLGEGRAMLEAVAGSAAREPPVRPLRMACDQEVRVASEVVLAHTGADDRRVRECREAARCVLAR